MERLYCTDYGILWYIVFDIIDKFFKKFSSSISFDFWQLIWYDNHCGNRLISYIYFQTLKITYGGKILQSRGALFPQVLKVEGNEAPSEIWF